MNSIYCHFRLYLTHAQFCLDCKPEPGFRNRDINVIMLSEDGPQQLALDNVFSLSFVC